MRSKSSETVVWTRVHVERDGRLWCFTTPDGEKHTFKTRDEARTALKLMKSDVQRSFEDGHLSRKALAG